MSTLLFAEIGVAKLHTFWLLLWLKQACWKSIALLQQRCVTPYSKARRGPYLDIRFTSLQSNTPMVPKNETPLTPNELPHKAQNGLTNNTTKKMP